MSRDNKPTAVNRSHFSLEEFPHIIAFCERDESTRLLHAEEETYQFKLEGRLVYVVKKKNNHWEIAEFHGDKIARVSTDAHLEMVLMKALYFVEADRNKQDERTNILIPVKSIDVERVTAIMYYLGGYPHSFFPYTPEVQFITNTFIDPELVFLSYSYVPVNYVDWLREELRNAGFIGQEKNSAIWIYKK